MRRSLLLIAPLAAALLSACDIPGMESAEAIAAAREAEGKAVGGACRHAGRAIEDCYALNRKADKAAVFAGWRDMNDYMRENKIEPVTPVIAGQQTVASAKGAGEDKAEATTASEKAAEKAPAKGGAAKAGAAKSKAKEHDS